MLDYSALECCEIEQTNINRDYIRLNLMVKRFFDNGVAKTLIGHRRLATLKIIYLCFFVSFQRILSFVFFSLNKVLLLLLDSEDVARLKCYHAKYN